MGKRTLRGRFREMTSLSASSVSKPTYSASPASLSRSAPRRVRLKYRTVMPNALAFRATLRPMPPMPRMPRTLPCGSRPSGGGGSPRHLPSRRERTEALRLRRAPRTSQTLRSDVASSTAVGVLETRSGAGSRAVHESTSIWSYPAPALLQLLLVLYLKTRGLAHRCGR